MTSPHRDTGSCVLYRVIIATIERTNEGSQRFHLDLLSRDNAQDWPTHYTLTGVLSRRCSHLGSMYFSKRRVRN